MDSIWLGDAIGAVFAIGLVMGFVVVCISYVANHMENANREAEERRKALKLIDDGKDWLSINFDNVELDLPAYSDTPDSKSILTVDVVDID